MRLRPGPTTNGYLRLIAWAIAGLVVISTYPAPVSSSDGGVELYPALPQCEFPPSGSVVRLRASIVCPEAATGYLQIERYRLVFFPTETLDNMILDSTTNNSVGLHMNLRGPRSIAGIEIPQEAPQPPVQVRFAVHHENRELGHDEVAHYPTDDNNRIHLSVRFNNEDEIGVKNLTFVLSLYSLEDPRKMIVPGWVLESTEDNPFRVRYDP